MDNSGDAQNPMFLVALLHQTFPQFAERDPKGALKQQDANEAWLSLAQYLNMMKVREINLLSFTTIPYEIFRAKRIAQV